MKKGILHKKILDKTVIILILFLSFLVNFAGQKKHHMPTAKHKFDDIQRWIELFEDPERAKWQKPDEVVKRLNLKSGHVIADIGAGTGYFTRRFAKAVLPSGKALGLDIDPSIVDYMREDAKKHQLENYIARVVEADDPGLNPKSVDVIFICNTYHHIENSVNYIKRLSKALKPNGRVVIVDFYKKPLPVGPQSLEHKIPRTKVLNEFQQAGYHLIRFHDFLPYQYFLEFQLKQ